MRYLIALFVPPLAVLLCGKLFQFLINAVIWVAGFPLLMFFGTGGALILIAIIHSLFVVSGYKAEKRNRQLIQAVAASRQ